MAKIAFDTRTFTPAGRDVIAEAERICNEYADQGYNLTLRQLYYRFIATDAFPDSRTDPVSGTKNTERNYKWLGGLVNDARWAGLIDWNHLEDRTRGSEGGDAGWAGPQQRIEAMPAGYVISKWDGQDHYVEAWIEKEALADVISRPCSAWNVTYLACKGYLSASELYQSALRIHREARAGRTCHIVYLGDHDPSGLDMPGDLQRRLDTMGIKVQVERIALTMDQILDLDPPPSPAKETDSRFASYVEQYHDPEVDEPGTARCWELDALPPDQLETLVQDSILGYLDMDGWNERVAQEERETAVLQAVADNWPDLLAYMRDRGMVGEDE